MGFKIILVTYFTFLNIIRPNYTLGDVTVKNDESDEDGIIVGSPVTAQVQEMTQKVPDEKLMTSSIRDIAYYIRYYKFNEWDRRYFSKKPGDAKIGYFAGFPVPPLTSIHWKVYESCNANFYKCITYLASVIGTDPINRRDDTVTILNEKLIPVDENTLANMDTECKRMHSDSETTGSPFDGPLEKFQWRTSAAYYMCWYTMLETPALTMLGENCDNFASCLDNKFGANNRDPRADDKMPFACALYSFCPDICCPRKHIKSVLQCRDSKENPCFAINFKGTPDERVCRMKRKLNQNFRDLIANKLNVSCFCKEKGFIWKSQFGLCVDKNECVTGEHRCDEITENCYNLPGTYDCVCKWGYRYEKNTNKCLAIELPSFTVLKSDTDEDNYNWADYLKCFLEYLGIIYIG